MRAADPPDCCCMNGISGVSALVSRMRELENSQPSPSIADVAGNPDTPGPDTPAAADLTSKYEMAALASALRANADQALTLIQMFDSPRSPLE
jgi:hypothetical protein